MLPARLLSAQQTPILDKRNKRERAEEPAIPPVDSDMISVRETARRLGICRQTTYNLAAKGIITIYHVTGRLSYVSWSEACATISTRTAPAIQQKPRRSTRKKHPEQPAETSSKAAVPAPPTAAKWLQPKSYAHVIAGIRPICTDSYSAIGFRASKTAVTRCTPFLR